MSPIHCTWIAVGLNAAVRDGYRQGEHRAVDGQLAADDTQRSRSAAGNYGAHALPR